MHTGRYRCCHAEDRGEEKHNGNHETEVLLVRRAKAPEIGKWTVPGGSLELGEHVRGGVQPKRCPHTADEDWCVLPGITLQDGVTSQASMMYSSAAWLQAESEV